MIFYRVATIKGRRLLTGISGPVLRSLFLLLERADTMTTYTVTPNTASTTTTPVSGKSPARSRADQDFGGTSTIFKAMTPQQKAGWQNAANFINAAQGRTGRRRISALNAFKRYASGLLALGQPVQMEAPTGAALNLPPQLPGVLVSITNTSPHFSVTLTPQTAVSNPVQILCAPPQIAGKLTWPDSSFAPIGHLMSMSTGANDISALVSAKYGPTEPGMELAFRLVATSSAGLRRGYLCVTGFCAGVSVADAGTDDNADLHVA